jgi:hypothetical protein
MQAAGYLCFRTAFAVFNRKLVIDAVKVGSSTIIALLPFRGAIRGFVTGRGLDTWRCENGDKGPPKFF